MRAKNKKVEAPKESPRKRKLKAGALGEGKLRLSSSEHVSAHLAQRLANGQRKDDAELKRVLTQAESIGSVDELAEHGIKPLMVMADSR